MRVDVTVPAVDELTLSGSGTIGAEGVDVDELPIALSGSGAVSASGVAQHVAVELNGWVTCSCRISSGRKYEPG